MKRNTITLILSLCIAGFITAQEDCKNSLYNANKLYESGQIKQAIDALEPCLENGLDKEGRFDAYRLLAIAYQNQNNNEKTDYYIRQMLQQRPDYQKFSSIDPLEFTKLINRYSVSPKLYVGLGFGINITSVKLADSYSVYETKQRYNPTVGYQFGLLADYRIQPDISISADLQLCGMTIEHEIDNAGNSSQKYTENQRFNLLSVSGRKYFNITKNIQAFAGLGIGVALMNKSNINLESVNFETKGILLATKDPIKERNKTQSFISGIIGAAYNADRGVLSLELNYATFLKTTVNENKRYADEDFIFNNQYLNDDIKLRSSFITLSYRLPLLWDIKLKK